jgi:hypothetical protein
MCLLLFVYWVPTVLIISDSRTRNCMRFVTLLASLLPFNAPSSSSSLKNNTYCAQVRGQRAGCTRQKQRETWKGIKQTEQTESFKKKKAAAYI